MSTLNLTPPGVILISSEKYPPQYQPIPPTQIAIFLARAKEMFPQLSFSRIVLSRPVCNYFSILISLLQLGCVVGECMIQLKGLDCDLLKIPSPESILDGYIWTGPVTRQTINIHPGVVLELTQIFGGVKDLNDNEEYKMCRHEYRLLAPTNRLFFVHYLALNAEGKCKARPFDAVPNAAASPIPFPQMPSIRSPMPPPHQMPNVSQQMRPPMPQTMKGQSMGPPPIPPPAQLPKKASTAAAPSAHTQEEQQQTLTMDENDGAPNQRVDLAYNRLRFQKQILAKLFCKASPQVPTIEIEEALPKAELSQLANLQIDVLKTEIERLGQVRDWLNHGIRERRLQMNKCFTQVSEANDEAHLDLLMSQWDEIK